MKSFALLIHGSLENEWLENIKNKINSFKYKFNQILFVVYADDYERYCLRLKELGLYERVQIVKVKDLINSGFFNINRQIMCVNKGLECIQDNSFVFKLRNDQCIDFNKVAKYSNTDKVITTNCFSRKDRLYHPSDMFLAANKELLVKMYSMPYQKETHVMTEMKNIKLYKENPELTYIPISPESALCRYYLKLNGWDTKNTFDDSFKALKKYYLILNSWNVDFRWNKKRTYLCPSGYIILPHYFSLKPFENAPEEKAVCFVQSDFENRFPTIKDFYFIAKSKIIWFLYSTKQKTNTKSSKNLYTILRYKMLKVLPYFLVEREVKRLKQKINN